MKTLFLASVTMLFSLVGYAYAAPASAVPAGILDKARPDMTLAQLEEWGDLSLLQATLLEGDGKIYGKYLINDPERNIDAGYFAVKKNKFSMTFPFSELATVLQGSVTLTNSATGERKTYHPGDSWIIRKGTPIVWETHSAEFIKYYFKVE
ncbi:MULTISPECIES: cupin domain-containing protein [Edwardsiella]|uniref:Cupin domain-containing protein n=2 Tax=Edwardsiella anguillarum TaxID=1821960 RepID=A0ABY8SIA5_9GAMM|nr:MULTISPECIES: cupin domain-containing protein [Edwardsiella]AIJ09768.1 putative cytoplasmic protein [Edwardsiella anguillarum ET080813]AKR79364.2 cupin domain-containing protein [Edwardsiella sp. LADL05-105]KAB0592705.1 DUF861 domain-containing protein [Edwardsiella anguillarum]UOU80525.1 cupin domain-containing protein [Edwardsiella anguillarum]WHP85270.1 cupin domain-containing protein [Edwardsiella anguillarum]